MRTVGRTFLTAGKFKHARWSLGRWSKPLTFVAFIWNLYLAAVLFSPIEFPVTAQTFNCMYSYQGGKESIVVLMSFSDSPVIFGGITIFGILSWLFTPEEKWLPAARLGKVHEFVEA